MKEAIDRFSENYECDSLNVIYFSGHGFNYNGIDYITGTNAKIESEHLYNALSLKYILSRYQGLHAYVVLIIDACRSFEGELKQSFLGIEMPKDTLIAYATQIGQEAFAGKKYNLSPFSKAIHNNILRSDLTFNEVFQFVRGDLANDKYVQVSCEVSTLTEEIPITCAYVSASDEEIYNFLMDTNNGTYMEAALKACDLYNRSYLDVLYSFSKVSYKKMY